MLARKENGGQILLKMSLVEPKDSKDENFDDLKSFKKKRKLENHLKTGLGNYYFEITGKGFERK